jgi:hypothetical protein
MINPKELRIGNLIRYTGAQYPFYPLKDGVVQVEEVLSDGVNRSQGDSTLYEANKLEGIKLTPEWLGRFGFETEGNGWKRGGFFLKKYKDDLVIGLYNGQVVNYTPIEYVHQLQNAYFSPHMREELTINETV